MFYYLRQGGYVFAFVCLSACQQNNLMKLFEGKGKGTYTWYSASSWIITSEALRYGTCSQGISQFYLHTHTFIRSYVHPQSECAIPAFAFPAIAGTHLPTPEGWKAELAWVAGYVVRQFTCPNAVTIPLLTGLNVEQLRWSRPTRYHYAKLKWLDMWLATAG